MDGLQLIFNFKIIKTENQSIKTHFIENQILIPSPFFELQTSIMIYFLH